jgi:class 3 adenylate cyclase
VRPTYLILVADDSEDYREIICWHLSKQGHELVTATTGDEALAKVAELRPDLVFLDVMMPGLSGIEVVRCIKADEELRYIPVILVTARSDIHSVTEALDAGGDDYLTKPIDAAALLARTRSALRQKELNHLLQTQAADLAREAQNVADLNRSLEERVATQVRQIERMQRLRRFLPSQVADQIVSSADVDTLLQSHRREVTVLFCDLRGFTRLTIAVDAETVMKILREYHTVIGELVTAYAGTLERFVGDGVVVVFNDPIPVVDHTERAVRLGLDMRDRVGRLAAEWRVKGHNLGFGVGISKGTATLGSIGFEGRLEYSVIGTVPNLAARLAEKAADGQVLVSRRVYEATENLFEATHVGDMSLKGFGRPMAVFNVLQVRHGPRSV